MSIPNLFRIGGGLYSLQISAVHCHRVILVQPVEFKVAETPPTRCECCSSWMKILITVGVNVEHLLCRKSISFCMNQESLDAHDKSGSNRRFIFRKFQISYDSHVNR
jgi:hypothetical protein